MKRQLSKIGLCMMAVLAAAACEKGSSDSIPSLNVSQALEVASTGGEYSFAYTVSNPVSDGQISGSASVSWLTDIDVSTEGTVRFAVDEYLGKDLRSGDIILTYTYSGGSVRERVGVVQYASGGFGFELEAAAVTAELNGGHCSFNYTVADFAEGGEMSCKADVSWISEFDCSEPGVVSFFVDANDGAELRTGNITAVYTYLGASESRTVAVVQDHYNGGEFTLDDVVGTYEATGSSSSSGNVETTWTLTIMKDGDDGLYIDGLVPKYSGKYDEYGDNRYSASAYLSEDMIVVPAQATSLKVSTSVGDGYFGYLACTNYVVETGSRWIGKANVRFSYDKDEGTWTSNYGNFACALSDPTLETSVVNLALVYYDVTNPVVVLRKIE